MNHPMLLAKGPFVNSYDGTCVSLIGLIVAERGQDKRQNSLNAIQVHTGLTALTWPHALRDMLLLSKERSCTGE